MPSPRIELPQFGPRQGESSRHLARSASQPDSGGPSGSAGKDYSTPSVPTSSRLPNLPRAKRPSISSHRHDANPAMALKVLEDIQGAVEGWHQELHLLLRQIQDLYLEGPIVEGWLETIAEDETSSPQPDFDSAVLRHADPGDLAGYVNRRWGQAADNLPRGDNPRYQLCQLDADGQMHCQLCPPDQLGYITMAVARYQRLRQYLSQKHYLEARLKRAVEVLARTRKELDIPPSQSSV